MNKLVALFFILLFPMLAYANEYRGVQLGDSCRKAIDTEINHGSKPVFPVSEMLIDKPAAFWIEQSGENFYLTYHCKEEHVNTIFLMAKDFPVSDAEELYKNFKQELLTIYGEPCVDWRNISFTNWLKVWIKTGFSTDYFNSIYWVFDSKATALLSIDESKHNDLVVTFRLAEPSDAVFVFSDGTEKSVVPDQYNCSI